MKSEVSDQALEAFRYYIGLGKDARVYRLIKGESEDLEFEKVN